MQDDSLVTFWNEKAETFPRYEAGDDNYEAGVLDKIKAHGVDFRSKTVLDIGSGSGMYTLRIAQEARRVTALDISERMLEILRGDAAKLGIDNIEYVCSSWEDYNGQEVYDIVFCSMNPALKSEEARYKLLRHAGGWTVFMGFGGVMDSDMLNGLYATYRIEPKVFDSGIKMRQWLDSQGVSYTNQLLEGRWVQKRGKEETIDHCATMLRRNSVELDRAVLERYLEPFQEEPGLYVEHTDYKIDLVLWEKGSDGAGA